jgi:hypothetical protein
MACELGAFVLTGGLKFLHFFGISKAIKTEKRYWQKAFTFCKILENIWLLIRIQSSIYDPK